MLGCPMMMVLIISIIKGVEKKSVDGDSGGR
jgi:hypothetical protein